MLCGLFLCRAPLESRQCAWACLLSEADPAPLPCRYRAGESFLSSPHRHLLAVASAHLEDPEHKTGLPALRFRALRFPDSSLESFALIGLLGSFWLSPP